MSIPTISYLDSLDKLIFVTKKKCRKNFNIHKTSCKKSASIAIYIPSFKKVKFEKLQVFHLAITNTLKDGFHPRLSYKQIQKASVWTPTCVQVIGLWPEIVEAMKNITQLI